MLVILAMAALAAALCGAGEDRTLSLDECIEYALKHNPSVRQAELSVQKVRTEAAASLSEWLPEINVYVGNNWSWGRSVDMQELMIVHNRMNYTASVSAAAEMPVTGYISKALRSRDLRLALAESETEKEITAARLAAQIISSFYQILLSEEACRNACSEYDDLTVKRKRVCDEVAAGLKTEIELIRIDSRIAEEKAALQEARAAVELDRRALISLLNLPPEGNLKILPPMEDSICSPDGLFEKTVTMGATLPEVRKAEIALERAKAGRKAAQSALLPEIGVTFGYGTYYGNGSSMALHKQLSSNHNPSVEIGLSIPLTGYFKKAQSIKTASLIVKDREVEMEKLISEQRRAFFDDISRATNLHDHYLSAVENLAFCEKEYAISELNYHEGGISWSEYILARNSKMRAEMAAAEAKYRYLMKIKEIEFKYGLKK